MSDAYTEGMKQGRYIQDTNPDLPNQLQTSHAKHCAIECGFIHKPEQEQYIQGYLAGYKQVGIHYVMWIGCLVGYKDKKSGEYIHAKNATALHDGAKLAVKAFCKEHQYHPLHGDFFPCPPELAAKAEWSIENK